MKSSIALVLAALLAPLAQAHVQVEPASASAGTNRKLTFSIGHGCEGSPTHTVTVVLPEGIKSAKAMPKAGWTISSVGREVSWKGGPLPDTQFDEFALQMRLPDAPGKLYFKVTQLCDKGRLDWTDLPQEGQQSKTPAPSIELVPATAPVHQH
jgi:uncharacterized protein YcnI